MEVTVIGAGVAGLCSAVELAERGCRVEVVERREGPAERHCSWFAGGMLAPFCELDVAEPIVAELGVESIDWWARRFDGTVRRGSLVVAHGRDSSELDAFAAKTRCYEWADAERIAELEPGLAGRFRRGLYFPGEAHFNPRAALAALRRRLEQLSVPVRYGVEAETDEAAGRRVVDCRGLAARDAGLALRGVKGEMIVLETAEVALSRPVRVLHPRIPLYVVPHGEGRFLVGATVLESDDCDRVRARAVAELIGGAYAVDPAFGEADLAEVGTHARPAFPDNVPRVSVTSGRVSVNGLYRHGFLLGPAMAAQAADAVLRENAGSRSRAEEAR